MMWSFGAGTVVTSRRIWNRLGCTCIPARDRELLAELIVDKRWSNEGLFALITDPTKAPMLYTHLSPSSD